MTSPASQEQLKQSLDLSGVGGQGSRREGREFLAGLCSNLTDECTEDLSTFRGRRWFRGRLARPSPS